MALQAPSLLAQLPRPLSGGTGKCQFSEVYSLAGSKKRKRYEIAAAIDGESVNIYNVQFPKLISSYAIPPQSSISCAPCSVKEKSAATSTAGERIRCFVENSVVDESASFRHVSCLEDSESPVVFTTVVPTAQALKGQGAAFDLITVHENGRVQKLSSDLKTQRWSILHPAYESSGEYEVRTCFVVSFEEAQKVLFRKRQDLIASILGDGRGIGSEISSILMVVTHPRQAKTLLPSEALVHLFSISPHDWTNGFAANGSQQLKHLMKMTLPDIPGQAPLDADNINWVLNLNQAELSLSFDRGYISYNISHYTPEVDSHMIVNNATFSSVMRISQRLVIGANQSTVSLYDAKYRSLQADLPIAEISHVSSNKQMDTPSSLEFITYFSKSSVSVAVYGSNLLAFDLTTMQNWGESSRKRQRAGLLIDSIGKGVAVLDRETKRPALDGNSLQCMTPLGLTDKAVANKWAQIMSELDSAVRAKDPEKFDQIMKTTFWNSLTPGADEKPKGFPHVKEYIDLERISFLLSKIFSLRSEGESNTPKLAISFVPFETLQWLVNSRHLSLGNIQAALRSSNPDRILPTIPDGSLVRALVQSVLSNSDILSIIHHLRHSLAAGGYTSRFTEDPPPAFSSSKIPRLPLSAIVELLNACIDAVGPSGWVSAAGFAGGEGSEASLIADMKSEVSAALAGVEEATYLKGILREFIRCCETAKKITQPKAEQRNKKDKVSSSEEVGWRVKRTERVNGAQILVYDDVADSSGLLNTDSKILPLSLKMTAASDMAAEEPSKTKVIKSTGEVKKRSQRDLSYLKGKAVGKYSFERIIV
ncbi:hypothetical protein CIHG_03348 [Coccidioides immitis H538.4]|uniref:Utp8 beta-propeller domain-containing protein n=1 Tax=Coccidioides immitis H538.4 TaxID=396776 RepID=A0A0J8RL06_COCIT|nr:hypothetical protein CIHG_03348 [Coccidioides immitis H538.4]